MHNDELQSLIDSGDLDAASDVLAEQLKPIVERTLVVRQRIRDGLTQDGKRLRRNAKCPCGSGKKFKKCCRRDFLDNQNPQQRREPTTDAIAPTDSDRPTEPEGSEGSPSDS